MYQRRNLQVLLLFGASLISIMPIVDGLQCYECLSLHCSSAAVCESIKRTMLQVFVPKGHIIHFNPQDPCPEHEDPSNSTKWAELRKECQRSDSVCLVSPIEVISVLDGSKHGKTLEPETKLTTTGFLRGCASRRKLQETDATIMVHVNLLSAGGKRKNATKDSSTGSSSSTGFGQPSQDLEMNEDLSQLKAEDGYQIKKIFSHEFYVDQGTENATKCFEDNCNTKVRYRNGAISVAEGNYFLRFIVAFSILVAHSNWRYC